MVPHLSINERTRVHAVSPTNGCVFVARDREGAYTEEEMLRLGREAGEQLKAEAGPEFTNWQH